MTNPKVRDEHSDKRAVRVRQGIRTENPAGIRILAKLAPRDSMWLAQQAELPPSTVSDAIKRGPARVEVAIAIARALKVDLSWLLTGSSSGGEDDPTGSDLVGINEIDMAYGLGGTYTDVPTETTVRHFDREWLRTITLAAPTDLTWTRGSGDSMETTIRDGDLVLIDRSQNAVLEDDAIWAFNIGEIGSIKRLRIRGAKVTILSDNQLVPPDTATHEEINIVGRVVFIGRKI